jgi:transposase
MECLYRQHLILPVAFFESAIGVWTASVHIEFTEKLNVSYGRSKVWRWVSERKASQEIHYRPRQTMG